MNLDQTAVALGGVIVTQATRILQQWRDSRRMRVFIRDIYRRLGRIDAHLDLTPTPIPGERQPPHEDPLAGFDKTNHGFRPTRK